MGSLAIGRPPHRIKPEYRHKIVGLPEMETTESPAGQSSGGTLENKCCIENTNANVQPYRAGTALAHSAAAEMPVQAHDEAGNILVNNESLGKGSLDIPSQDNAKRLSSTTLARSTTPSESTPPAWSDDPARLEILRSGELCSNPGLDDYFVLEAPLIADLANESRVTSTSTLASSAFGSSDIQHNTTSAPHSPHSQPGAIEGPSIPTSNSVTVTGKPPRPTSVPIVTSNSSSTRRRRDGPEYPRYPDQSFAALQAPDYPQAYQPHPLRTRSSHTSQNSSFSSIPSRSSRDQIALVTGAKTVGGTPAQSPGLFSPVYPASRSQMEESEGSQASTPLMHPAHTQTPKE